MATATVAAAPAAAAPPRGVCPASLVFRASPKEATGDCSGKKRLVPCNEQICPGKEAPAAQKASASQANQKLPPSRVFKQQQRSSTQCARRFDGRQAGGRLTLPSTAQSCTFSCNEHAHAAGKDRESQLYCRLPPSSQRAVLKLNSTAVVTTSGACTFARRMQATATIACQCVFWVKMRPWL